MLKRIRLYSLRIGIILTTIFVGGYAVALRNIEFEEFQTSILPLFKFADSNLSSQELYEFALTMRSWFAITMFVFAILFFLYFYLDRKGKEFFKFLTTIVMGLVVLFGTQLVAYPIAFFFFLSAVARWLETDKKEIQFNEN